MAKEMNKFKLIVIKYDIFINLFLSLIIMIFSSFVMAGVFTIGFLVSTINYVLLNYYIKKYLAKNNIKVIISSVLRIIIVVAIIYPFIYDFKLVLMYLFGFIMHYIVFTYCTLKEKGSA